MFHRFQIIKRAYLWLTIGGILLVGSWLLFFMNANFSEEFTGGVNITVVGSLDKEQVTKAIVKYMEAQGYANNKVSLQVGKEQTSISLVSNIQNDEKVAVLSKDVQAFLINGKYINGPEQILQQSITGPSVGDYMKNTAVKALILGLIFMSIYMMFAFANIRKYVSPSILAGVTIATMIFDISIPAGAYGFWMMLNPLITVNTVFIIAILTNMGYSINDTIVIFDRIRENIQLKGHQQGAVLGQIFEDSLRQTMRRSLGTVFATLLVIICMYILGTGVIRDFAFTIGIGIIAGSYSSIFISAPLAYLLLHKEKSGKKA